MSSEPTIHDVPLPLVAIALDARRRLLAHNGAFARRFGAAAAAADTLDDWLALVTPEAGRGEARARCESLLDGGHADGGVELSLRAGPDELRTFLASAERQSERAVVVLVDVTDRLRAEERLRTSEARHRLLAENARDVVWTMAPTGEITYVSPLVEKVRGVGPEEAMRQSIDQIHPPASAAKSLGYFVQLGADLAAGRPPPSFRGELEYYCKDGSTFWTEVIALPITDEAGHVVEILGVTRDLSERKAAEDALKRSLADNERLVAELRASLQEVKTLSGLLPICMFCKKIRNDQGYWDRLEHYFSAHADVTFSHGLCSDCAREHFPE